MDEQMEVQRQRDPNKKKLLNVGETPSQASVDNKTVTSATNLFTKNGSQVLPPRRQQLACTNVDIQGTDGVSAPQGNQY